MIQTAMANAENKLDVR